MTAKFKMTHTWQKKKNKKSFKILSPEKPSLNPHLYWWLFGLCRYHYHSASSNTCYSLPTPPSCSSRQTVKKSFWRCLVFKITCRVPVIPWGLLSVFPWVLWAVISRGFPPTQYQLSVSVSLNQMDTPRGSFSASEPRNLVMHLV